MFLRQMNESKQENESEKVCKKNKIHRAKEGAECIEKKKIH